MKWYPKRKGSMESHRATGAVARSRQFSDGTVRSASTPTPPPAYRAAPRKRWMRGAVATSPASEAVAATEAGAVADSVAAAEAVAAAGAVAPAEAVVAPEAAVAT